MMSRSSVSILCQISPGVLCSRWVSGLKRAGFGRGFRYRIDIGFVGIAVQNLSGFSMHPISILYQTAPLKLVLFVQILKKIGLPCGASSKFHRSSFKVALPRGVS